MGLYEGIKGVAKIVQQADNIDLYKTLLDLGAQALDLQAEIFALKKENEILKSEIEHKKRVIRHKGLYVTLEDEEEIFYCAACYGKEEKYIQMFKYDNASYKCPVCHIYADVTG